MRLLYVLSVMAIAFGGLTIFSGGRALFGGTEAEAAVGNAVSFVLWFNFLAGFFYVLTGIGLLRRWQWSASAAVALALTTAIAAASFAIHVMTGGLYEMRTMGAMAIRLGFWVLLAVVAKRHASA